MSAVVTFALDEGVARLVPAEDEIGLVVEDEVAAVGAHHQDGVSLALVVDHHHHPHRATRQALLGEHLALEELVVLTVAVAVLGQVPAIHHPPMVLVRERLDRRVDVPIDGLDRVPGRLCETNAADAAEPSVAFAAMPVKSAHAHNGVVCWNPGRSSELGRPAVFCSRPLASDPEPAPMSDAATSARSAAKRSPTDEERVWSTPKACRIAPLACR